MKVVLCFVLMISCTVAANLLMKAGAIAGPDGRILKAVHWKTLIGFAAFGLAGLIYAWLLKWLPLNVAQSFAAAQFIAVILASAIVLAEPVSAPRWLGITFIAVGIALVGATIDGSGTPIDPLR
jgi:drug/metabolite transporter (DMT)-like permease